MTTEWEHVNQQETCARCGAAFRVLEYRLHVCSQCMRPTCDRCGEWHVTSRERPRDMARVESAQDPVIRGGEWFCFDCRPSKRRAAAH